MQAQHNPDNLQCVREPQYLVTKRRIFSAQPPALFSTTILGNGSPAPSLTAVTFFVNFNSGATICHGVPHKPSQFVDSQHLSGSVLSNNGTRLKEKKLVSTRIETLPYTTLEKTPFASNSCARSCSIRVGWSRLAESGQGGGQIFALFLSQPSFCFLCFPISEVFRGIAVVSARFHH